ncbi:hypothetical protein QBC34DRAFT_404582 [Podospora aff. communis PSN243]|uniref:Uncharacterized protein n=1 Tax=Podospora aff. communis PSN243 TaxID=3040156 RepID=A0AAV9GNS2_9PEZI|nr:hypothetical protein QBC34DRAFT_404582 [Podospora aff. communis PSN243]
MFLSHAAAWAVGFMICTGSVLGAPNGAAPSGPNADVAPAAMRPRFTAEDIQFTPGHGLPSLESLNLTAVELVEQALIEIENEEKGAVASPGAIGPLTRRSALFCGSGKDTLYRASTRACGNYLNALGNTPCVVRQRACFCLITIGQGGHYDAVQIEGIKWADALEVSSYCRHVAHAVYVQEEACKENTLRMWRGREAAYGNAGLMVFSYPDTGCRPF